MSLFSIALPGVGDGERQEREEVLGARQDEAVPVERRTLHKKESLKYNIKTQLPNSKSWHGQLCFLKQNHRETKTLKGLLVLSRFISSLFIVYSELEILDLLYDCISFNYIVICTHQLLLLLDYRKLAKEERWKKLSILGLFGLQLLPVLIGCLHRTIESWPKKSGSSSTHRPQTTPPRVDL